jgi:hypothetical protein
MGFNSRQAFAPINDTLQAFALSASQIGATRFANYPTIFAN